MLIMPSSYSRQALSIPQLRVSYHPPYLSLSLSSFCGAYQDDSIESVGLFYIFPFCSILTYLCGPFFSLTAGCPHTVSPHIQHLLTLLHPMWGLFMSSASLSSPSFPLPSMSSFLPTIFLPHSRVPSHCFTLVQPNPPTPIIYVIRFSMSSPSFPLHSMVGRVHVVAE